MSDDQTTEIHAGSLTGADLETQIVTQASPFPPTLPMLSALPREGEPDAATRTRDMAAEMLHHVEQWAHVAMRLADFEQADDVRRRVSSLADVIERRGLSRTAIVDAQTATRWAERALGGAVETGQALGLVRSEGLAQPTLPSPARIIGPAAGRILFYASAPDTHWTGALAICRKAESVSADAMVRALVTLADPSVDTTGAVVVEVEPEPEPEPVVVPAVDVVETTANILRALEGASADADRVRAAGVDTLSPELAADTASAMWRSLVPIMALRKELMTRGG